MKPGLHRCRTAGDFGKGEIFMGTGIRKLYREKVKREWKIAFLSAFLLGLLVHIYKFTNTLPNHDSLWHGYTDLNVVDSGRWFLSPACGISSYFDLPWVNGLLSIFYIALTCVVITELFHLKNPVVIILCNGLLVTFPGITETYFYEFTADGYMLAMLLSTLAVYFSTFEKRNVWYFLLSAALLCLACGIYQSYVSFAMLLTLFYFIQELLENRRSNKECGLYIAKQAGIYVLGLGAYYAIWKICLAVQHAAANDYLGIGSAGASGGFLSGILSGFKESFHTCRSFFTDGNFWHFDVTLYPILNIIFLVFLLAGLIIAVKKSGIYHRALQLVLMILAIIAVCPCACIWLLVSNTLEYRPMMLLSLCLLYFCGAILFDRWCHVKLSGVMGLLLAFIVFNNGLLANIGYYYQHQCYEVSYATGVEMVARIHEAESEDPFDSIAVIGQVDTGLAARPGPNMRAHITVSRLTSSLLNNREHVALFLNGVLALNRAFATDEECSALQQTEEVREMPVWPASDSVQVIDGTLILKLSN